MVDNAGSQDRQTGQLPPQVIVVMGVSGTGKTSIGEALAQANGWPFMEGDSLHPPANIAKMSAGTPLTDADRWPWLDRVRDWIAERLREGHGGVVTCSALRRVYRDRLREAGPGVRFVYLRTPREELAERLRQRRHFMPASLLDSQLATLEPPAVDELSIQIPGDEPVDAQVRQTLAALAAHATQRPVR